MDRLGPIMKYEAVTHDIRVAVEPKFLADQSSPQHSHYVWAYSVEIENLGLRPVQLINRYWCITDANGRREEVRGPGVVGEQPLIEPGRRFEYTSGAPLKTPSGIMSGRYEMDDRNGGRFEVEIPAFSLDSPHQTIQLN